MKQGDVFNENNLRIIRPGLGLLPKYYEILIGRNSNQDLKKGMPLKWDYWIRITQQKIFMKRNI